MAGSDVPPGGPGAPPGSPATPEQHKKRKSGAAAADKGASSASGSSGRVTRSMSSAKVDVSPEQPRKRKSGAASADKGASSGSAGRVTRSMASDRVDASPGGSGAPPVSPEQPRKRKSGAGAADEGAASGSGSGSGSARYDEQTSALVDSAMAWTRRAAEGALWEVRGRNRGIDDEDQLTAVMLGLRFWSFENVDPDHPDTPDPKKQKRLCGQGIRSSERIASEQIQPPSFLASRTTSARPKARVDPVAYQAAVPEWVNKPSQEDKAEYENDNETSQKMGMAVTLRLPRIVERPKTRNTVDNKCKCPDPGSEACVRLHVKQAWKTVRNELGKDGFKSCGFDAMGERVLNAWTAEDKNTLADIEKLVPQNNHEDFMKIALEQFSSERTMDLSQYYYNVFLPRRLASLNRAEAANALGNDQDDDKNAEGLEEKRRGSTDDEGNNQDDDKNVRHSEEKIKGSGSSSKRSRK